MTMPNTADCETMMDAAIRYAEAGFHILPVKPTKAPHTTHGAKDATTDISQITDWWTVWPNAGIGAVPGMSGCLAFDLDGPDDLAAFGTLGIDTARTRSGRAEGGEHAWIRHSEAHRIKSPMVTIAGRSILVRGMDSYVIMAPSPYQRTDGGDATNDAETYTHVGDGTELPIAEADDVIIDAVSVSDRAASDPVHDERLDQFLDRYADWQPMGELQVADITEAIGNGRQNGGRYPAMRDGMTKLLRSLHEGKIRVHGHEAIARIEDAYVDEVGERRRSEVRRYGKWVVGQIDHDVATNRTQLTAAAGTMATTTLADILDTVETFLRRFIVFTDDEQATAVTLWIVNTWVFTAFDTTPYMAVTSPEKQAGKTRLLEVIGLLARAPIQAANLSSAATFRIIEDRKPTLLIDEVDAIFTAKRGDERQEELRGIVNSGYQSSGNVLRVVGHKHEVVEFSTYCPKVLAGIGELPDTIADRSIPVRMERKPRSVVVERFRLRFIRPQAEQITAAIALQVDETLLAELERALPNIPDALSDRAADIWEPLLAIADEASDPWGTRARQAASNLSTARTDAEDTIGVRLLSDIRDIWHREGFPTAMHTQTILNELHKDDEAPWASWYGAPLTARNLAKLLHPFGVKSGDVKVHTITRKGYRREHLVPPWDRYLTPLPTGGSATPATSATSATSLAPQGKARGYLNATQGLPPATGNGEVAEGSPWVAHEVAPRNPVIPKEVAEVAQVAPPPTDDNTKETT